MRFLRLTLALLLTLTLAGQPVLAAISATQVWRVRITGSNNTNGAGYDALANVAATGSAASSVGGTNAMITDPAALFTSGMVGASINVQGIGQWAITTFTDSSHIVVSGYVPPIVSNTWTVGAGTDYSQQNAAQVSFNGTTITATTSGTSTTVLITGYAAAATDANNTVHITGGTNFTAGWYTIVSVSPGVSGVGTWTLDRNATSGAGTGMTGSMGGAWADPQTNLASTGPLAAGNTVYALGSGIPTKGSGGTMTTDYTLSSFVSTANGNRTTGGFITLAADPATTNYATGGMPSIKTAGLAYNGAADLKFKRLWLFETGTNNTGVIRSLNAVLEDIVYDQNGYDQALVDNPIEVIGLYAFSSRAAQATNANHIIDTSTTISATIRGININGVIGPGVKLSQSSILVDGIIAKIGGNAVTVPNPGADFRTMVIKNMTIDANGGDGIHFDTQLALANTEVMNNIITNHTGSGKYGQTVGAGTAAQNDRVALRNDFNVYYGNTNDLNLLGYGPNDQKTGVNPYVNQGASPPDYTLTSTYVNTGYPKVKFPGY